MMKASADMRRIMLLPSNNLKAISFIQVLLQFYHGTVASSRFYYDLFKVNIVLFDLLSSTMLEEHLVKPS